MTDHNLNQVSVDLTGLDAFDDQISQAAAAMPHVAAVETVQSRYAKEATYRLELKARLEASEREALANFHACYPDAKDLKVLGSWTIFKANPTKSRVVIPGLLERLTWKGWASKSQREIAENLANACGIKVDKNVWSSQLNAKVIQRFKLSLSASQLHDLTVDLTGCRTLASIKKAIVAATEAQSGVQKVKVDLLFTQNALVIGNVSYPLANRNGSKSYKVNYGGKQHWLNVDALQFLIDKSVD